LEQIPRNCIVLGLGEKLQAFKFSETLYNSVT